jgi:hypothetical protein
MRESRTTDQHGSEFAYFRMNTELPFHGESARKDLRSFQGEPCALIYVKARLRWLIGRRPRGTFDKSAVTATCSRSEPIVGGGSARARGFFISA